MNPAARWIVIAGVIVCLAAAWAVCAPEPKLVTTDWQLDTRMDPPRRIEVTVEGEVTPRTFWYVLYTVTNRTGDDRPFVPCFTIYTDTGQLLADSKGVPSTVFEAIQIRHNNPLLTGVADMTGVLLQGADNAKDGVAIFGDIEPEARVFDLFVDGLSGEAVQLRLPTPVVLKRTDSEGRVQQIRDDTIMLHKTLQLTYKLPGEFAARAAGGVVADGRRWVMR